MPVGITQPEQEAERSHLHAYIQSREWMGSRMRLHNHKTYSTSHWFIYICMVSMPFNQVWYICLDRLGVLISLDLINDGLNNLTIWSILNKFQPLFELFYGYVHIFKRGMPVSFLFCFIFPTWHKLESSRKRQAYYFSSCFQFPEFNEIRIHKTNFPFQDIFSHYFIIAI